MAERLSETNNSMVLVNSSGAPSMSSRDPRAEELNNLKVALATFAVQLDAFEARIKGRPPGRFVPTTHLSSIDVGFAKKIVSAMKNPPVEH